MSSDDIWITSEEDGSGSGGSLQRTILSHEELAALRQRASAAENPTDTGMRALSQNPFFVMDNPPPSPPLVPFLPTERVSPSDDGTSESISIDPYNENCTVQDGGDLILDLESDPTVDESGYDGDRSIYSGTGTENPREIRPNRSLQERYWTSGSQTTAQSDVDDNRSVFSFHSSVDSHLFKDSHGRTFNTLNKAYHLPADMEEHERLDIQHKVTCYSLGGLYPAQDLVDPLLRPNQHHTPMVLDIGSGSGTWAIEVATKFSHVEVVGLDLVPPKLFDRIVPDNCRFEVDDANLPLVPHYENTFDFIHMRAADAGIHDFENFLYNIAQIMRPGGILILNSGSPQFFNENGEPHRVVVEGERGFSSLQKFFSASYTAHRRLKESASPLAAQHWHRWAESNANYEDVVSWQMRVPIGNWLPPGTSPDHQYAAELNRFNIMNILKSLCPMMISDGYKPEIVERWRAAATKEVMDMKPRTCSNWTWTWCRRTQSSWVPNPAGTMDNSESKPTVS